jgi:hypothetical protein
MKFIYLSGLMLLCFACSAVFYARAKVDTPQGRPPLQLTTSIVNQRYCAGDEDLDSLQLELRLCYTNIGRQPLILYKGSNNISCVMASHNAEDAAAGRFEANGSVTTVTAESHVEIEAAAPGEMFLVLPPGASYETEAEVSVLVARGGVSQVAGAVTAGEYVLQVKVPTWTESDDLAKKLRRRWRQGGFLWFEPITATPMPFRVEKQRPVVSCS